MNIGNAGSFVRTLLLSALTVPLAGSLRADLSDGLVARWTMEEVVGNKVVDQSGHGRDLTLGDGCYASNFTFGVSHRIPSVYFTGTTDAWATFTSPAMTNRTLVIWLCRDEGWGPLPASDNAVPFLCFGVSSSALSFSRSTENLEPYYQGSDSRRSYPKKTLSPGHGTWHQLAVTLECTGAASGGFIPCVQTLYLDGRQVSKDAISDMPDTLAFAGTAIVGNAAVGGLRPIFGHLGECRVYDRALSDFEVRQCFLARTRGALLAQWRMETIETDASGRYVPGEPGGPDLRVGPSVSVEVGIDGKALVFNPTDTTTLEGTWARSVKVPDRILGATVSFWLNVAPDILATRSIKTSTGLANDWSRIIEHSDGTRVMINNDNGMAVDHDDLYGALMAKGGSYFYHGYPEKGRWSQLTVVTEITKGGVDDAARTGTYSVYVNGELIKGPVACTDLSNYILFNDGLFKLGNALGANDPVTSNCRVFKGQFDDVRIYAGALTAEEIRAVYRGAAKPEAGADFAVASDVAELRGCVSDAAGLAYRNGYAGNVRWSLVEAPAGADVMIVQPGSAVTAVALPVAGAYRFRLSAEAAGVIRSDDVVVTRVSLKAGNLAPTLSVPAAATFALWDANVLQATATDPDAAPGTLRVSWSKVSGPGGVWFEAAAAEGTPVSFSKAGAYVLRCKAEDGQDAVTADVSVTVTGASDFDPSSITNGMFAFYPFTGGVVTSFVAGAASATMSGLCRTQHFEAALDGVGYRGATNGLCYADLGAQGMKESGENGQAPTDEWRAVSLWMYHDSSAQPG